MLDLLLSDTGKAVPKLNLAITEVAAQLSRASIGALASAATAAGSSHTCSPCMQQPFFGSDIMLHGSSGGGSAAVPLPLSFAWGGSAAAAAAAVSSGRTPLRSSSHWQYYSRGVTDLGRYELLSDEMHVLSRGQRDK
jgi:hypothetical protein